MAAEWIPCGGGFIEADVIRWNEGVWQKPRGRRGRTVNAGERMVIAEVIRDEGGWVDLLVRDCTIASEKPGGKVLLLAKNAEVRRKRRTIQKGKPERLLWSDETVRALLVSKFLGGKSADEGPS
jgi:xanthine/CO dehydrogenase XdhC/CoxF family maturation factor